MGPAPADTTKWWTLAGFSLVLYASVAFKSMVGIAIPDLQQDLGASFGQIQWVLNAYTLMLAALLITAGVVADRLGRRRVYVVGLAVFAIGATACLVSPSATLLDLSSGLMGLGGAIIFAAGAGLVSVRFTGRDRATAFAVVSAASTGAAASGPLLAGVLIDGFGWRGVFGFLVVLGLAGLAIEATRGAASDAAPAAAKRVDWIGPLTFGGGIFLLVFVLVRGNEEGFGSPLIVACVIGAVAMLVACAAVQVALGRPASDREPMLDPVVLRRPSVLGAALSHFVLAFVVFGSTFYVAIHLGPILGNSPTEVGIMFLPMTAVAVAAASLGAWLMRRYPARALLAGCLVAMAVGSLLLRAVGPEADWTALIPGFAVLGVASGVMIPVVVSTAVSVVPQPRAGVGAAINNTSRQLGIAFGVAGLGSFFEARVASRVTGDAGNIVAGGFDPGDGTASAAFFAGLDELFLVLAAVSVAGALLTLALVRARDFVVPLGGRGPAAVDASESFGALNPSRAR